MKNYARAGDPRFDETITCGKVVGVSYRGMGNLIAVTLVTDESERESVQIARWQVNGNGVWVRVTKGVTVYACELLNLRDAVVNAVAELLPGIG